MSAHTGGNPFESCSEKRMRIALEKIERLCRENEMQGGASQYKILGAIKDETRSALRPSSSW